MYLTTLPLIALSTLSTISLTLAFPLTNTTLSTRNSYGWIGEYDGPGCAGDPDSSIARPELHKGKCVQWSFGYLGERVGIDWGAGKNFDFGVVTAFSSYDCSGPVSGKVEKKGYEAGACVSMNETGCQGDCLWRSVIAS